MNIVELVERDKRSLTTGWFSQKPSNVYAKTLRQWLFEGFKPVDLYSCGEYYASFKNPNAGYKFFRKDEVEPLTEKEKVYVMNKYPNAKIKFEKPKGLLYPDALKNIIKYKNDNAISLRIETTGKDTSSDEVVGMVIANFNENNKIQKIYSGIFHPVFKHSWSQETIQKTGISPDFIKNAPYPKEEKEKIKKIIDEANFVVVSSLKEVNTYLRRSFGFVIPESKAIDLIKIAGIDMPNEDHKLGSIVEYYSNSNVYASYQNNQRNTLFDTYISLFIMDYVKNKVFSKIQNQEYFEVIGKEMEEDYEEEQEPEI